MFPKSEYLVNLIFKKFKKYKSKEIFLEKEELNKFISSLLKEYWIKKVFYENCYSWNYVLVILMYDFSSLTIFLIIAFIMSLYFLFKVTSNTHN